MADVTATVSGIIRQSVFKFVSGGTAWREGQPQLADNVASGVTNSTDRNTSSLYMLFGYSGANISVTDIRFNLISFDVSSISSATSATLKIWGYTNSATGDPGGHSTDGIQGWAIKDNGMASTTSVTTSDWGDLYSTGPAAPTLLTDNLTSWNTGTSTPNTFTINATGLSNIANNNLFQIAIGHKFWHDNWDANPPFAHGNNAPDGSDTFSAIAGAYHGFGGSYASYKPVLSVVEEAAAPPPPPTNLKIVGGNTKLNGGNLKIDNN